MAKKKFKESKKIIKEKLLRNIKSYLLNFSDTLEVSKIEFEKENINISKFSKIIDNYIDAFDFIEDETFFKLLDKDINKLEIYFQDIPMNVFEIKSTIKSIEDKIQYYKSNKSIEPINNITIKKFFSITEINLINLKNKKEIYIVGENGDGKTLLLQAIAVGLKGTQEDGLKEFRVRENEFTIEIENKEECKNNFLAYGSSRNNSCQLKEDTTGYLTLFSNEYDLKSPIKWLIDLYNAQNAKEKTVISLDSAIKLLKYLLNREIEIEVTYNNVLFKEKGSEVSFEQLSAGYRGVITIICDMIARLSEKQQVENIQDFQGIVLIDEVELHLHPKWKYNFMKKLCDTFPLVQFIVTTHSPTVILGASKEAVFYKIYKEDGEVKISNQIPNEGYTHNSLISSPLFDLDSITSRDYDNRRVSSDDYVYDKIHEVVSERIKKEVNTSEEDIMKLINEELDKL